MAQLDGALERVARAIENKPAEWAQPFGKRQNGAPSNRTIRRGSVLRAVSQLRAAVARAHNDGAELHFWVIKRQLTRPLQTTSTASPLLRVRYSSRAVAAAERQTLRRLNDTSFRVFHRHRSSRCLRAPTRGLVVRRDLLRNNRKCAGRIPDHGTSEVPSHESGGPSDFGMSVLRTIVLTARRSLWNTGRPTNTRRMRVRRRVSDTAERVHHLGGFDRTRAGGNSWRDHGRTRRGAKFNVGAARPRVHGAVHSESQDPQNRRLTLRCTGRLNRARELRVQHHPSLRFNAGKR